MLINAYGFVCEESNIHITIELSGSRIAHIKMFYDDKLAISRKYIFNKINSENINDLVSAFCSLISEDRLRDTRYEREEDTSDFLLSVIRSSLKRVYTKLGLLIWEAN